MLDIDRYMLRVQGYYKESTLKRKINTLKRFEEFLKKNGLELNEHSIELFLDELRQRCNPGTVRNAFFDIKSYVEVMRLNIDLSLTQKYLPKYVNKEADYLEPEEIKQLLEVASPMYRALYAIMYAYARRAGEVLRLKWKDIDFVNKRIRFVILKKKTEEYAEYPLEDWIEDLLLEVERKDERVFPITIQRLWKKFKRDCKKAGIYKDCSPHILRHSRITHLGRAGVDLVVIQKYIARHSKLETTASIYRHVMKEEIEEIPPASVTLQL